MSCNVFRKAEEAGAEASLPPPPRAPGASKLTQSNIDALARILDTVLQQQVDLNRLSEQNLTLATSMRANHEDVCRRLGEHGASLASLPIPAVETVKGQPNPYGIDPKNFQPDFHWGDPDHTGSASKVDDGKHPHKPPPARPHKRGNILAAAVDHKRMSGKGCQEDHLTLTPLERFRQFIKSMRFDIYAGAVISFNVVFVFAELQMKGYSNGYHLGVNQDDGGWISAHPAFESAEVGFNAFYIVELILRVWASPSTFFHDRINVFDSLTVVACSSEIFIFRPAGLGANLNMIRILRLVRMAKLMKFLRLLNAVSELRILLKTLSVSVGSLVWSMSLLGVIQIGMGFFMYVLAESWIQDQALAEEQRLWLYDNFGTAVRSSYVMFEAAFSSAWTYKAWRMIEEVHPMFALFWILYTVLINFAVIRVVAALFLKQTLNVASNDAERMAMEHMKSKKSFAMLLQQCFAMADTSGDGVISHDEFEAMVDNPEIMDQLEALDVDVDEVGMLFSVLADDDGEVDYQEFLAGALKMKNPSRCIDTIQILHELGTIRSRTVAFKDLTMKLDLIISFMRSGMSAHAPPHTNGTGLPAGALKY